MEKNKAYKLARALESGKYKQGIGFLRTKKNEFCCLGVACEIAKIPSFKKQGPYYGYGLDLDQSEEETLPECAQKVTGINTREGTFKKPIRCRNKKNDVFKTYHSLADLNDSGFSFKFIAEIIRKHYENIK